MFGIRDLQVGIAPFLTGVVVVGALIMAVVYGIRRRRRDPRISRPAPEPPMGRPTSHDTELREPDELPQDGRRRTAHELHGHGTPSTRPGEQGKRRRWDRGTRGGGAPKDER